MQYVIFFIFNKDKNNNEDLALWINQKLR